MHRHCVVVSLLLLWTAAGCRPAPSEVRQARKSIDASQPAHGAKSNERRLPRPVRVGEGLVAERTTTANTEGELTPEQAAQLAWEAVEQSASLSPTLLVWLFDETRSAQSLVSRVTAQLKNCYLARQKAASDAGTSPSSNSKLTTAVVGYGSEARYLLGTPSTDPKKVAEALDATRVVDTPEERLFDVLTRILDTYLPQRPTEGRLILGIVTDEMGDDWQRVDQLTPKIRRESIAVYVIGPPAPFGLVQAVKNSPESAPSEFPSPDYVPYRQGPETRYVERVVSDHGLGTFDLSLMDSGFGPFALEWLCRVGGGAYLAIRPRQLSQYVGIQPDIWPSPYAPRFRRDVMLRYLPDYVTEEEYRRLLEQNSAARAVHEAAKVGTIRTLHSPQLVFSGKDEAEINRVATTAQQQAALAIRSVNEVYELLKNGEKDRDRLPSRRWQVSFDLAYGQACLAKAQIDGYNSMLARLKRGMKFDNPSSTMWVLEPAEEYPESLLQVMADRGRNLLQGIIQNHPQTPWSLIAEQVLKQPPGWRWTEK